MNSFVHAKPRIDAKSFLRRVMSHWILIHTSEDWRTFSTRGIRSWIMSELGESFAFWAKAFLMNDDDIIHGQFASIVKTLMTDPLVSYLFRFYWMFFNVCPNSSIAYHNGSQTFWCFCILFCLSHFIVSLYVIGMLSHWLLGGPRSMTPGILLEALSKFNYALVITWIC